MIVAAVFAWVEGRLLTGAYMPAEQSGQGVASNPELLPPTFGEHAGQNVASSTPPKAMAVSRVDSG